MRRYNQNQESDLKKWKNASISWLMITLFTFSAYVILGNSLIHPHLWFLLVIFQLLLTLGALWKYEIAIKKGY